MADSYPIKPSEDSLDAAEEQKLDWDYLRQRSVLPGGFGDERTTIWPRLLHVSPTLIHKPPFPGSEEAQTDAINSIPNSEEVSILGVDAPEHRDERQIQLDTDRSFVLYPVDGLKQRESLQSQLHDLIVSVFRKRPLLNYFQGYHDIISVLFLTLPEELQLVCAEKLSLHRARDSMGSSLEPVVGLLRVLNHVLSLADPEFAEVLSRNAPLPYYALSNLLTLFSHDIPTLPLIQHVFDYLLSRPPIAIIYLAAAVVLSRKEEVIKVEEEGEEGMTHSLLSSLPAIYDEDGVHYVVESVKEEVFEVKELMMPDAEDMADQTDEDAFELPDKGDTPVSSPVLNGVADVARTGATDIVSDDDLSSASMPNEPETGAGPVASTDEASDSITSIGQETQDNTEDARPQLPPALLRTDSPEPAPPRPETPINASSHRPRVSLTLLLKQADTLYEQYPPSHPSIALTTIMGPQSVVLTWSEDPSELPTDDEAERMVTRPDLVVLPFVDETLHSKEQVESSDEDEETEKERGKASGKRRRRKLRKPRRLTTMGLQRRTVVASAVLVLGVAMAVYGTGRYAGAGLGDNSHRASGREWRNFGRFFAALLVGTGDRLLDMWG